MFQTTTTTTTTTRSFLFSSSSSSSSSFSTSRRNRNRNRNRSFVVRVAFDDDDGGKKRIEREGLERREPRKRGPRRTIQQVVSTPATGAAAPSDPSRKEGEEAAAAEAKGSEKKIKRTKKTSSSSSSSSSSSLTDRWMKDPLSALISIPRIALGATTELVVEKGGNPSDALNALAANAPRVFSSSVGALSGGGDGKEQVALMRDLEAELERLERKGAKAAKPVREALVKPNLDAETYERYFATRDGDEEEGEKTGDDEDKDEGDEGDEGFYDASNDTGTDEEVAKAASDVADALSGMDLADLYSSSSTTTTEKEKEEEENGATRERLSLNVIAESVSRKAEMDGVSPEAVEYTIEENLSNVVMETATVSATRRRAVSSTTTTPTSTTEISNKYYSSATTTISSSSNSSNSSSAAKEEEKEIAAASDNSYVQKFNGKWKRDDQLDESKLMDLFEMNNIFRAANSALTQLDVGASASQFSLKASYGIISVNESYSYDQEVRQNRRDARSGAQYGRVTLDSQSESITLKSRWTAPLEGNMTETFAIEK